MALWHGKHEGARHGIAPWVEITFTHDSEGYRGVSAMAGGEPVSVASCDYGFALGKHPWIRLNGSLIDRGRVTRDGVTLVVVGTASGPLTAAWECKACDVAGTDPETVPWEARCWNCGELAVITARFETAA